MLIATFTFPLDPAVLPVPFVPLLAGRGITTLLTATSVGKRLVSKSVFLIALPVPSVNVTIRTSVYPLQHEQGTAKTLNCIRCVLKSAERSKRGMKIEFSSQHCEVRM